MAIKYTEEQLNTVDKSLVIQMLLTEQEHTEQLTKQVAELNAKLTAMDEKMQKLIDQLILANKNPLGRSTEAMEDATQISFTESQTRKEKCGKARAGSVRLGNGARGPLSVRERTDINLWQKWVETASGCIIPKIYIHPGTG